MRPRGSVTAAVIDRTSVLEVWQTRMEAIAPAHEIGSVMAPQAAAVVSALLAGFGPAVR